MSSTQAVWGGPCPQLHQNLGQAVFQELQNRKIPTSKHKEEKHV